MVLDIVEGEKRGEARNWPKLILGQKHRENMGRGGGVETDIFKCALTAVGPPFTVLVSSSRFAFISLSPRCQALDSVMTVCERQTARRCPTPRCRPCCTLAGSSLALVLAPKMDFWCFTVTMTNSLDSVAVPQRYPEGGPHGAVACSGSRIASNRETVRCRLLPCSAVATAPCQPGADLVLEHQWSGATRVHGTSGEVLPASGTPAGALLEELACAVLAAGSSTFAAAGSSCANNTSKRAPLSVLVHFGLSKEPHTPRTCGILIAPIAGVGAHGVPTSLSSVQAALFSQGAARST